MSAGLVNKFMGLMGINNERGMDEYEDENEYDELNEDGVEQEEFYEKPSARNRRSFSEIERENPYSTKNIQTKVIPMNTAISSSKMVISQPTCYEDVEAIGDYLKNKKSVIINLENVGKEDARRILDFLSGAAFMIEGTIQKVSNLIYLMAPKNVEIQNDIERSQYSKQKMSFSWLK
ncbi:MAG: cell division protein SepF [Clostridia bacterium]